MGRSITAKCFLNGIETQIKRPAGEIVAKDKLKDKTRVISLLCIGDKLFLSYQTDVIDGNFGIQVFSTVDFRLLGELVGLGGVLVSHENGQSILASGLNAIQSPASTYLLDLDLDVLTALPLCYPYQSWGEEKGQIIANVNIVLGDFYQKLSLQQPELSGKTLIPSMLLDLSYLRSVEHLLGQPMLLDLPNRAVRRLLDEDLPISRLGISGSSAIAPRSGIICYINRFMVQAIQIETGKILWRREILKTSSEYFYLPGKLAINSEETRLAITEFPNGSMGWGFTLLDLRSGECIHPQPSTPQALRYAASELAWHPSGWLAIGYSSGKIAHWFPDREEVRTYTGTRRKIFSLAFIDNANCLVVGTVENHLRKFELLLDET
jgi:hypothetical protein